MASRTARAGRAPRSTAGNPVRSLNRNATNSGEAYLSERVDYQPNPNRASSSRVLIAADPSVDGHRVVRLCCERSDRDPLGVSLLVAAADGSRAWSESGPTAERRLRKTTALLEAAGFRLEDVIVAGEEDRRVDELVRSGGFDTLLVCAAHDGSSSPVLPLAAALARLHGLTVVGGHPKAAGQTSWLRRVVEPLLHWPRW